MKGIFKSIMFVAVAAMTLTACSEKDNSEVKAVVNSHSIEFVMAFEDDTRSGFSDERDGERYKSVWHGNEKIKVIVTDATDKYNYVEGEGHIDALPAGVESSEVAHFTVTFDRELPASGSIEVYAGEWIEGLTLTPNIRKSQSYNNYSVGAASHISKANVVNYTDGAPSTAELVFAPEVAFGKIIMSQFEAEAGAISEVKVTLNGSDTYTLTPEAGAVMTEPVAWFACAGGTEVTSLTVEATVNGVKYVKSAEGLNVVLNKNKVRPINVSNMARPAADYSVNLTKVASMVDNEIRFENEDGSDHITISFNPGLAEIVAGHYNAVGPDYANGIYAWNWSSEDALEFFYEAYGESTEVTADGGQGAFYNNNGIDITIDAEGVYNIVAHFQMLIDGDLKTVDFNYVGTLEAEQAKIAEDSDFYAIKYEGDYYDKVFKLYSHTIGELWINIYGGPDVGNTTHTLKEGTYNQDDGLYFIEGYGQYKPVGVSEFFTTAPKSMSLEVSVVDDMYKFVINADYSNFMAGAVIENAVFHGEITGLDLP